MLLIGGCMDNAILFTGLLPEFLKQGNTRTTYDLTCMISSRRVVYWQLRCSLLMCHVVS